MNISIQENYGTINSYDHVAIGTINNYAGLEKNVSSSDGKQASNLVRREAEDVTGEEVHDAPEKEQEKTTLDTSFFRISKNRSYDACMEKLMWILSSSNKKAAICRQLFDEEGRQWFNLDENTAEKIVALLAQFPCKLVITIDDIRKAKLRANQLRIIKKSMQDQNQKGKQNF